MNSYQFGPHRVESEIALGGLSACPIDANVRPIAIVRHSAGVPDGADWHLLSDDEDVRAETRVRSWRGGADLRLRFEYRDYCADFVLTERGTRIAVATSGGVPDAHLATLIEGPILGRALRLQGRSCLHATILVLGDKAIGLTGPSGAGKSTLAAAMVRAGCDLLADDLAFLEADGEELRALPGKAQVKLWPDAAARNGVGGAPVLPGVPAVDKIVVPMVQRHHAAVRFETVYQLSGRDSELSEARIDDLAPPAALAAIAANLYGTVPFDRALRQAELRHAAQLAPRLRTRRLTLPDRIAYPDENAAELRARLFA